MRPHGLLLAVLLAELLIIGGGAWAGEDMDEQHSPSPPFRVSGTVISLPTKIALVVVLDAQGKSTGEFKLHEGDTVEGYRIVYEVLGLDKAYTNQILARRAKQ